MNSMRAVTRISPVNMWSNEAFSKLTSPEQFGKPHKVEVCFVNDPRTGMQYRMETSYILENEPANPNLNMSFKCRQVPGLIPARTCESLPTSTDESNLYFLNVPREIKSGIQTNIEPNKSRKSADESELSKKLLEPLLQYFIENECLICGFIALYESDQDGIQHMTSHIRQNYYLCDCCRVPHMSASELYKHRIDKTKKKPYVCEICSKKFKRNYFLTSHLRSDHVAPPVIATATQPQSTASSIMQKSGESTINISPKLKQISVESTLSSLSELKQINYEPTLSTLSELKQINYEPTLSTLSELKQINYEPTLSTLSELKQINDEPILINISELKRKSVEITLTNSPQLKESTSELKQTSVESILNHSLQLKHVESTLINCPRLEQYSDLEAKEIPEGSALKNSLKDNLKISPKFKQTPEKSAKLRSKCSDAKKIIQPYSFVCTICHRKFNSLQHISHHRRCHQGIERFKCLICFKHFFKSSILKHHHHVSKESNQRPKISCVSNTSSAQSTLSNSPAEFVSSNSHPFAKSGVNNSHQSKRKQRRSLKKKNQGAKMSSVSNTSSAFAPSAKNVSISSPSAKSDVNNSLQSKQKQRRRRRQRNKQKCSFGCLLCGIKFNSLQFIGYHGRYHGGIERFKCLICSKSFFKSSVLKHHHHVKTSEESKRSLVNNSPVTDALPSVVNNLPQSKQKKSALNQSKQKQSTPEQKSYSNVKPSKVKSPVSDVLPTAESVVSNPPQSKQRQSALNQSKQKQSTPEQKSYSSVKSSVSVLPSAKSVINNPPQSKQKQSALSPSKQKQSPPKQKSYSNMKPSFMCIICHRKFHSLQFISDHRRCHGGVEKFKCMFCFKYFCNSGVLKYHHHHLKPQTDCLRCKICKKIFQSASSLEEHKKCHKRKQLFSCSVCNEKFYQEGKLLEHKKIVHAENFK